jgi:hypothetical protein
MKKLILMAAAAIVSTAGFAQLSVGIQGIGNLSDATFKEENGINITKKMKAMPGFGVVAQYQVKDNWAVRSGLSYLKHGVKATAEIPEWADQPAYTSKSESDLNYLQVPVNILYTRSLSRIKFFAGGGVFLNYGLSGKVKIENTTMEDGTPYTFKDEVDAFKKVKENGMGMKRTEFGVGALAGVQLHHLFANVGYQRRGRW